MKLKSLFLILPISIILSGCTTSVVDIGGGLYTVQSTGAGFDPSAETKNVYDAANKFAKEKGKVVYVESIKVTPGRLAQNPPEAMLTFSLVEPGSIKSKNNKLTPGLQKIQILNNQEQETKKENLDTPAKLEKLKKLYDSNFITKEEYDIKRKELLNNF